MAVLDPVGKASPEDDGAEVVIVGEVVPVLRRVKVLLVRLVLHRRQTELAKLQTTPRLREPVADCFSEGYCVFGISVSTF